MSSGGRKRRFHFDGRESDPRHSSFYDEERDCAGGCRIGLPQALPFAVTTPPWACLEIEKCLIPKI
jgi:hypothetical protein